eukprot:9886543-Lingulodinium_polyedra.AAC.1
MLPPGAEWRATLTTKIPVGHQCRPEPSSWAPQTSICATGPPLSRPQYITRLWWHFAALGLPRA